MIFGLTRHLFLFVSIRQEMNVSVADMGGGSSDQSSTHNCQLLPKGRYYNYNDNNNDNNNNNIINS